MSKTRVQTGIWLLKQFASRHRKDFLFQHGLLKVGLNAKPSYKGSSTWFLHLDQPLAVVASWLIKADHEVGEFASRWPSGTDRTRALGELRAPARQERPLRLENGRTACDGA